jgi:hypothetical protein
MERILTVCTSIPLNSAGASLMQMARVSGYCLQSVGQFRRELYIDIKLVTEKEIS